MKPGFEPGIVREVVFTVAEDMCPVFEGQVIHRCCSTWTIAHHFEVAARKVLVEFLEAHEEGVGSYVSVDHLAPCGVGKSIRIRAQLTDVSHGSHARVVCELSAFDGERLLAKGKQIQVVMDKNHLKQYIERS